jgi:hypothetical protein
MGSLYNPNMVHKQVMVHDIFKIRVRVLAGLGLNIDAN